MAQRKEIEKIDRIIEKEMNPLRNRHYAYCLLLDELSAMGAEVRENEMAYQGLLRVFDYGFIKGMRYYKKHGQKG